jgi:branched-chain amino acid transport system substrate-binding protein
MAEKIGLTRRALGALALSTALLAGPLTGPLAAQQPVKLGTVLSVTGPASFLGEDMKKGMEIAIEGINAAGGINGRRIEWVFYDAESQAAKGVNATKRLIEQDKVDLIVGGGNMSGIALGMAPLAEKAEMPFISTEGAYAIVSPVAERQYVFKTTLDDAQVVERAIDYWKKKGIKKVALVADNSGFGQGAKAQMETLAPQHGIEVVYESFTPSDTTLVPQLTRVKAANVGAILCWTTAPSGVVFLKEVKQLGLDDKMIMHSYGFVSQQYMELAGDAAKGLLLIGQKFPVATDLPASDPVKTASEALAGKFTKAYGKAPNMFAAQTYDAIMMAKYAVAAGDGDRHKIRDALEHLAGFKGLGGNFSFSKERHSGLTKADAVIMTWQDGRFRLVDY